jgi:hypothetical protein
MSHSALDTALRQRLAVVADHALRERDPTAHLAALRQAHQALEREIAALPPTADPRLLHFLQQQSYAKAIDFLENQKA